MGECGYCEASVYAGHAPSCIHRCQARATFPGWQEPVQCERGVNHRGVHEVYDDEGMDVVCSWPNRLGDDGSV